MSRNLLTLLPGPSRSLDRVCLNERIAIRIYDPLKDASLTPEQAKGRPCVIRVSEEGGPEQEFSFVLPCYFWGECSSIEDLAQELGERIEVGRPVEDADEIGRSTLRYWIALGDGSVYSCAKPGGSTTLFVNRWPVDLAPQLLSEAKDQQLAERFESRDIGQVN